MIYTLLTIYNQEQPPENDDLFPRFDEQWNLQLATDEAIVWVGSAEEAIYGGSGIKGWTLKDVEITITTRRVVYLCRKFKHGQRWWGFGGLGVLFAILMRIITALIAMYQRQGKAAVGQIRYQWPRSVMQRTSKLHSLSGSPHSVNIMVSDANKQNFILKLRMPKESCDEVTFHLVEQIATLRVNRDFNPKKFPHDDPKKIDKVKAETLERLVRKVKSDETNKEIVDYYEFSKTSLPVPTLE